MKTHLSHLSIAAALLSLQLLSADTLFELVFPYATQWTHPVYGGLGNGPGDLDRDGEEDDIVRGASFGSPESEEYKTQAKFTEAGPVFMMRAMAGALDEPASAEIPIVGSHGVTRAAFRMEGTTEKSIKYGKMVYAGWLLFPEVNFAKKPLKLADALSLEAEATNKEKMEWRLLIKSGGSFYVSAEKSTKGELKISNLASAQWISYNHAEKGRSLRLVPENGEMKKGIQLQNLEGIGVYVEKAEYDGDELMPRFELTQIRLEK